MRERRGRAAWNRPGTPGGREVPRPRKLRGDTGSPGGGGEDTVLLGKLGLTEGAHWAAEVGA